jgi:adenylate kinase family enzyme
MKTLHSNKPIVVFILGGPGSGKGTQSNLIK